MSHFCLEHSWSYFRQSSGVLLTYRDTQIWSGWRGLKTRRHIIIFGWGHSPLSTWQRGRMRLPSSAWKESPPSPAWMSLTHHLNPSPVQQLSQGHSSCRCSSGHIISSCSQTPPHPSNHTTFSSGLCRFSVSFCFLRSLCFFESLCLDFQWPPRYCCRGKELDHHCPP